MFAYEYEGEYIESDKALDYIKQQTRIHDEDKEMVLDWFWDELQEDEKLRKKFEEWFFQEVPRYIDEKEIELGNRIDHDFELGRAVGWI